MKEQRTKVKQQPILLKLSNASSGIMKSHNTSIKIEISPTSDNIELFLQNCQQPSLDEAAARALDSYITRGDKNFHLSISKQ